MATNFFPPEATNRGITCLQLLPTGFKSEEDERIVAGWDSTIFLELSSPARLSCVLVFLGDGKGVYHVLCASAFAHPPGCANGFIIVWKYNVRACLAVIGGHSSPVEYIDFVVERA